MFNLLFERPHALERQESTALLAERRRYLQHLARQEMSRRMLKLAAQYTVAIVERLHLTDTACQKVTSAVIERQAVLWARRDFRRLITRPNISRGRFRRFATDWLRFIGRLQAPRRRVGPFNEKVEAFSCYMRDEQGLSSNTIETRLCTLHLFLSHMGRSRRSLHRITVRDIDQALTEWSASRGHNRNTIQTTACTLRAFFRFAGQKKWCEPSLAISIQSPRVYTGSDVPRGPSWDQVRRLVAMTNGRGPSAIRDRAIILLLSVYGLRAGEVRGLWLEDFDWERELLKVRRPKQRRAQEYPLIRPVGDAVLRYLQEVRPASKHRHVFLTRRPPYHPLGSLWRLVAIKLRALRVGLPHCGPHSLRHACATHLLNQGLSLKEIGDHLGHRHPDTTRIYAKVDLTHLREVGQLDLRGLV